MNYLPENKKWSEITRDERTYCAELFFEIRNAGAFSFVKFLNDHTSLALPTDKSWEIGYEVCFYRDYLKALNKPVNPSKYPQKRTFDLCLFGECDVVIIEAKAQQGFTAKQNEEFSKDVERMEEILGLKGHVHVIALASSVYYNNLEKYGYKLPELFSGNAISWAEIAEWCSNDFVKQADGIYKK